MKDKMIQVIVNLPEEQVEFLKAVSTIRGCSVTDAIISAINTERFFVENASNGNKLLVEYEDGKLKIIANGTVVQEWG
jgi:penicillin V acylase-like amidase (Ntn superfamily)